MIDGFQHHSGLHNTNKSSVGSTVLQRSSALRRSSLQSEISGGGGGGNSSTIPGPTSAGGTSSNSNNNNNSSNNNSSNSNKPPGLQRKMTVIMSQKSGSEDAESEQVPPPQSDATETHSAFELLNMYRWLCGLKPVQPHKIRARACEIMHCLLSDEVRFKSRMDSAKVKDMHRYCHDVLDFNQGRNSVSKSSRFALFYGEFTLVSAVRQSLLCRHVFNPLNPPELEFGSLLSSSASSSSKAAARENLNQISTHKLFKSWWVLFIF